MGRELFNVVPIKSRQAPGDVATYTAPETRINDTLPEAPPEYRSSSDIEKRIFNWLKVHALRKGLHNEGDAELAGLLAKHIAYAMHWESELKRLGYTYEKANMIGEVTHMIRPEYKFLQDANKQIMILMKMLRMDPASRRAIIPLNRKLTADVNRWGT